MRSGTGPHKLAPQNRVVYIAASGKTRRKKSESPCSSNQLQTKRPITDSGDSPVFGLTKRGYDHSTLSVDGWRFQRPQCHGAVSFPVGVP